MWAPHPGPPPTPHPQLNKTTSHRLSPFKRSSTNTIPFPSPSPPRDGPKPNTTRGVHHRIEKTEAAEDFLPPAGSLLLLRLLPSDGLRGRERQREREPRGDHAGHRRWRRVGGRVDPAGQLRRGGRAGGGGRGWLARRRRRSGWAAAVRALPGGLLPLPEATRQQPRHLHVQRGHSVLQRGVQEGADRNGRRDGEEGEEEHLQQGGATHPKPQGGGVHSEASQSSRRFDPRRLTTDKLEELKVRKLLRDCAARFPAGQDQMILTPYHQKLSLTSYIYGFVFLFKPPLLFWWWC